MIRDEQNVVWMKERKNAREGSQRRRRMASSEFTLYLLPLNHFTLPALTPCEIDARFQTPIPNQDASVADADMASSHHSEQT